jgi:hypothetical protein
MTVREFVDAMIARMGIQNATAKQHEMLRQGVRSSLENHVGKTMERAGEGSPMRWRLIAAKSRVDPVQGGSVSPSRLRMTAM